MNGAFKKCFSAHCKGLHCVALVCLVAVFTSAGASALLQAKDLEADLVILRRAYTELHPGLYRYNTKAEMDADFAALGMQLSHDQTIEDAFLAFSEFTSKIRCGHTQANPLNQSKSLIVTLFKTTTRLPFYFDWVERRMIVTRDFTPDQSLPPGTEVISIDDLPTSTILARLLTITRADGANDDKRVSQLAVTGDGEYETFDIYFPMFFPQTSVVRVLLVRKPQADKVERIAVKVLSFDERIAPIAARESQRKGGDAAQFEWRVLADRTAYLKMPTWALYNSKWNWKSWLTLHLNEASRSRSPALIVDLRGNEGGDDVGNEILAHLIDAPMTVTTMQRLVRYRKIPDDIEPNLETWDKSFRDWGTFAVDLPNAWPTAPAGVPYFKLTRYDEDARGDVIKPSGKRFRGKLIVLIDAANSSATFQFAQAVQSHHLGTLIGQPTGGSQRGINGGAFFFLRLPHSGIELDLPVTGTFPPSPAPDTGITPDIIVESTVADIASGRDAGLDAATEAARHALH